MSRIYVLNLWKHSSFCKSLQVFMIRNTKQNAIVKPWRFLQGDIDNENQVTLLMGDYEKKQREVYRSYIAHTDRFQAVSFYY